MGSLTRNVMFLIARRRACINVMYRGIVQFVLQIGESEAPRVIWGSLYYVIDKSRVDFLIAQIMYQQLIPCHNRETCDAFMKTDPVFQHNI